MKRENEADEKSIIQLFVRLAVPAGSVSSVALAVLIALAVSIVGATFKTCASMNRLKRRAYTSGAGTRCRRPPLAAALAKHRFSAIFAAPYKRQDIDDPEVR